MKEKYRNQLGMKEALRYHDALARTLRGTATREDYLTVAKTEYKKNRMGRN